MAAGSIRVLPFYLPPSAFPRTSSASGANSIQLGLSWSVLVWALFWSSPAVVAAADAQLVSTSTKGRSVGADGAPLLIWRRSNSLPGQYIGARLASGGCFPYGGAGGCSYPWDVEMPSQRHDDGLIVGSRPNGTLFSTMPAM
ncbi:hypothetical protein GY45DRAFT_563441 [Cubamyces sp. BRFM 1775]|nr:hypothetical protein GY45DRAFT_563441 [Cubamyces sp. BRFM 1775]